MIREYGYPVRMTEWERHNEGWFSPAGLYGTADALDAALVLRHARASVSVGIGIGYNGFHAAVLSCIEKDGLCVDHRLSLVRRDEVSVTLAACLLSGCGICPETGEAFSLGIRRDGNTYTALVNGKTVLECTDPYADRPGTEKGRVGVRISPERGAEIRSLRVSFIPEEPPEKPGQIPDAVEWKTDFSGKDDEKYWLSDETSGVWQIKREDGRNVFGIGYAEGFSESGLHVFEADPVVRMVFRAERTDDRSSFGLFIRSSPETAYLKAGYDCGKKCWFMKDTPSETDRPIQTLYQSRRSDMPVGEWHELSVEARGKAVCVSLDGMPVLRTDAALHDGIGRLGVFADHCSLFMREFSCRLPGGLLPEKGVRAYTVPTREHTASMQTVELENGELLGLCKTGMFISSDRGYSFRALPEDNIYRGADPEGQYQSLLRLKNGKYLQIRLPSFEVLGSENCIDWSHRGWVVEDLQGRSGLFHTAALREITRSSGNTRLFLPVSWRVNPDPDRICAGTWKVYDPAAGSMKTCKRGEDRIAVPPSSQGHYTEFYYSDDEGRSWTKAQTDSRDLLPVRPKLMDAYSWAEPKVILCPDGLLRSYYSRNRMGCMQYITSADEGVTWSGPYAVPEMQCAASSYAIAEDPYEKNVWYMVWVNSAPLVRGSLQGRFRVSLARSHDGKNWSFLADLERIPLCYSDYAESYVPLYHIVDPSITVLKDHVLAAFGRSYRSDPAENGLWKYHHDQKVRAVRLEKTYLTEKPWNAATVEDLSFPRSIRVIKQPDRVCFAVGERFSAAGGIAEEELLSGCRIQKPLDELVMPAEPDMSCSGEKTVRLYEPDGYSCCEVRITVR